jgi:hypothetical protein
VQGHPAARSPSGDSLSPRTRPGYVSRCRPVPSGLAVTSTPGPATHARRSAVSALPPIHGHRPAAGDLDDRPVPARQVIDAGPGSPPAPRCPGQHPIPQLPDEVNGTDQALHAVRTPSAGHQSPTAHGSLRDAKPGSRPRSSTKSPTPHTPHRPHQRWANTIIFTHFCWPEAGLESSRDRTRTYKLPVNRRSVPRGATCCCRSPSARLICINARHGLTGPP